jgi:hypothetical protein
MLHTLQNAAYYGDLGKKFGKKFKTMFGKSENDLNFLENDRSFARLSERSCHEPSLVDFDTCWKYNTIYNGIKILVLKDKNLEKFFQTFFQTFPNSLEISKLFDKFQTLWKKV